MNQWGCRIATDSGQSVDDPSAGLGVTDCDKERQVQLGHLIDRSNDRHGKEPREWRVWVVVKESGHTHATSGREIVDLTSEPACADHDESLLVSLHRQHLPGVDVKRTIDVVGSAVLLIVLSPIIAAIAVLVAVRLGRPVIFRHERPGRNGEPFTLLKFRTMTGATGHDGQLLPDEDRLTPFGRRLRASSLDELPELWNVLRGDLSLVGPRPLLTDYLAVYTPRQARRHEVRPGVTGWVQVNGRNDLPWSEKLEMDVWYVENRSLWLDIRILLRTLAVPFERRGISRSGHATAPRFDEEQRDA